MLLFVLRPAAAVVAQPPIAPTTLTLRPPLQVWTGLLMAMQAAGAAQAAAAGAQGTRPYLPGVDPRLLHRPFPPGPCRPAAGSAD